MWVYFPDLNWLERLRVGVEDIKYMTNEKNVCESTNTPSLQDIAKHTDYGCTESSVQRGWNKIFTGNLENWKTRNNKQLEEIEKWKTTWTGSPLEVVFQEQSYSSLHSGRSLAWDHFRGDIINPFGVIADPCSIIADPCGIVVLWGDWWPRGLRCGNADRCATHWTS